MNIVIKAAHYADLAHKGQLRKYSRVPHIIHPGRVAARVTLYQFANEEMIAAAWLHDVVEDTSITIEDIEKNFGNVIAGYVRDMTNPSKERPDLNRAKRKELDRKHLAQVVDEVKIVKAYDRIDNLYDMYGAGLEFLTLYHQESYLLRNSLQDVDYVVDTDYRAALSKVEEWIVERGGKVKI